MDDITFKILQALLSIAIILIMRYVIPYLRIKVIAITDEAVFNAILKEVKSVEQLYKNSEKTGLGPIKKDDVIERITLWVNKHNIKISQSQISQLIETAVFVMNNREKEDD